MNSTNNGYLFPESDDGNNNEPSSITEDWDLTSPLILRSNHNTSSWSTRSQQGSLGHSVENLEEEEDDGKFHIAVQEEEEGEYSQFHFSSQEGEDRKGEEERELLISGFESKEYYHTLLSTAFTMVFIILVSGSYFFEWSDTVLRVQVDTVVAKEDDEDVGGYSGYRYETGQKLSVDVVSASFCCYD